MFGGGRGKMNRRQSVGFMDDMWADKVAKLAPSRQRVLYTSIAVVEFVVISVFGTFLYYREPQFALYWVLSQLCLVLYILRDQTRNAYALPCSAAIVFGVSIGAACAFLNYKELFINVNFYDVAQTYRNVVATEPAMSLPDAGRILFSEDTFVDKSRGIGYKHKGSIYCVAPVTQQGQSTNAQKVQFWAVGRNCCETVGAFACDDSALAGVHSGAVVLEKTHPLYKSQSELFREAKMKAEGTFHLPHNEDALYVRWLKDPNEVRSEFVGKSIIFFFVSIGLFAIFAYFFSWLLVGVLSKMIGGMTIRAKGNGGLGIRGSYGQAGLY